jgi:hypothetical protein
LLFGAIFQNISVIWGNFSTLTSLEFEHSLAVALVSKIELDFCFLKENRAYSSFIKSKNDQKYPPMLK